MAIPRFLRGFRRLYAGIGLPSNLTLFGLENCCPGNGTVGSIPTLSAKLSSLLFGLSGLFRLFGSKNRRNRAKQMSQISRFRLSSVPFPLTLA